MRPNNKSIIAAMQKVHRQLVSTYGEPDDGVPYYDSPGFCVMVVKVARIMDEGNYAAFPDSNDDPWKTATKDEKPLLSHIAQAIYDAAMEAAPQ